MVQFSNKIGGQDTPAASAMSTGTAWPACIFIDT
jgi:hypothetical protein